MYGRLPKSCSLGISGIAGNRELFGNVVFRKLMKLPILGTIESSRQDRAPRMNFLLCFLKFDAGGGERHDGFEEHRGVGRIIGQVEGERGVFLLNAIFEDADDDS